MIEFCRRKAVAVGQIVHVSNDVAVQLAVSYVFAYIIEKLVKLANSIDVELIEFVLRIVYVLVWFRLIIAHFVKPARNYLEWSANVALVYE